MPRASRPKVRKRCSKCGKIGDHYTRANGKPLSCVRCTKARTAEWQAQNPGRVRASQRRYDGSEKGKAALAVYQKANAATIRARQREWVARNPEKRKAAQSRYNNSDKGKAARARCRETNREAVLAAERRYRQSGKGRANQQRYKRSDKGLAAARKRRQSIKHTAAYKAREAVRHAVMEGAFDKPCACSRCDRRVRVTRDLHFHHTDGYAKANWFVGEWLCVRCHEAEHPQ